MLRAERGHNLLTEPDKGNQWRTERGGGGFQPPPPPIPKALQNRAKLNPIVKTVKNC